MTPRTPGFSKKARGKNAVFRTERYMTNKNTPNSRTRELVLSYLQIALGCLIGGASYPMFMTPNRIAPGGLTGLATILNYLWGLPIGTVSLVMNIPLFLIGFHAMGRVFVFRSLVATVLFSLCIDILPLQPVTMDPLLATLYGGVLLGVGLGLILRGGATTGGTDMVARLVHRRIPAVSVGAFLFAIDCVVVLAAGFIMGTSEALYALICIYLSSRVIDVVMIGFTGNKACLVISPSWEKISQRVMKEMDRGVTQLSARGGYTGEARPTLLCVVSRMEVTHLKRIIREEDEGAFVIIMEAHEAIGDGFSGLTEG